MEHRATQDSCIYNDFELYIIKAPSYRRQNNRHIDCGPLKLNERRRRITVLLWESLSICVYTPHVYKLYTCKKYHVRMLKDTVVHVRIWWIMETPSDQNSPACTKSVSLHKRQC